MNQLRLVGYSIESMWIGGGSVLRCGCSEFPVIHESKGISMDIAECSVCGAAWQRFECALFDFNGEVW